MNAHIFLWIDFRSNGVQHEPILGGGITPSRVLAWLPLYRGGLKEADRNRTCGFSGATL